MAHKEGGKKSHPPSFSPRFFSPPRAYLLLFLGWPYTVNDPSESVETNKFRKKIERDPNFTGAVKELCVNVENCIKQNNQIDLFEEYFYNEDSEHFVENISTKTLMLFK